MVDSGYTTPNYMIFPLGLTDKAERNVEAAINPGRLAIRGTTDYDIKPANCLKPVVGWAGWEEALGRYQPVDLDTAYAVSAVTYIGKCPGKPVFVPAGLPKGFVAEEGDILIPWGTAGQVAPAVKIGGGFGVKVPFTKKASEFDTNIDLPAGILVNGWRVDAVTAASGATIDIGILSTEVGGDADGFVDGASLAATGTVFPGSVDASAANNTTGALLVESDITSADTPALSLSVPTPYKCDGTAKSITYTTSDHTVAGFFYLVVEAAGIEPVGKVAATVDASAATADTDIMVTSLI